MVETYCFLFDECLTPDLVAVAIAAGHPAFHVNHLGLTSRSDRAVALAALEGDYVLVTNNRLDFIKIYRNFDVHAGLVVIIPNVTARRQRVLFGSIIDHLRGEASLVNKLVEIDGDGHIHMVDWPVQIDQ